MKTLADRLQAWLIILAAVLIREAAQAGCPEPDGTLDRLSPRALARSLSLELLSQRSFLLSVLRGLVDHGHKARALVAHASLGELAEVHSLGCLSLCSLLSLLCLCHLSFPLASHELFGRLGIEKRAAFFGLLDGAIP